MESLYIREHVSFQLHGEEHQVLVGTQDVQHYRPWISAWQATRLRHTLHGKDRGKQLRYIFQELVTYFINVYIFNQNQ